MTHNLDHLADRLVCSEVRTLLEDYPAFSPDFGFHVSLPKPRFNGGDRAQWTIEVDGAPRSAAEILGNWYFDRPGPKQAIAYP